SVFVNFAADDGAQTRHDVAAEPAAAHDDPEALSKRLDGAVTGDGFGGDDDHSRESSKSLAERSARFRRVSPDGPNQWLRAPRNRPKAGLSKIRCRFLPQHPATY